VREPSRRCYHYKAGKVIEAGPGLGERYFFTRGQTESGGYHRVNSPDLPVRKTLEEAQADGRVGKRRGGDAGMEPDEMLIHLCDTCAYSEEECKPDSLRVRDGRTVECDGYEPCSD